MLRPLAIRYFARRCVDGVIDDEFVAALQRLLADAQTAWPTLTIDPEALCAALHRYLMRVAPQDDSTWLALAQLSDASELGATACLCESAPSAHVLRVIDQRYLPIARTTLRRRGIADDVAQDAEGRIREKLFLLDANGLAGLDRYVGSGRFESFIRVVAVRESISLLRSQQRGPNSLAFADSLHEGAVLADEGLVELIAPHANPEAAAIKAELKQEFHRALTTAFATLTPRQRTCLRMHLLDGVSLDGLAAMYSVHRATICRWLEQAREGLRTATRTTLRDRLALDTVEFESMLRTLQSGVDWSFNQMMGVGTSVDVPGS